MIVSKTPLRISFFSGGSDIQSFYSKAPGAALSITIDKHIYCCVHETPHVGIKLMYDKVEEYAKIDKVQHEIIKQSLKQYDFDNELTIASVSDIQAQGSGLGSSSAFTVGLVNCLSNIRGIPLWKQQLAEAACEIEIDRCGYPIGKQDQYAAAYGGLNLFEFHMNGSTTIRNETLAPGVLDKLNDNLVLVYSGRGRSANEILAKQSAAMSEDDKFALVQRAVNKAYQGMHYLMGGEIDAFGDLLHSAWQDKKGVVKEITQDYFDYIYASVLDAGAFGGKLLGAGGGGFFLFYVPQTAREDVLKVIAKHDECKVYDFKFTSEGSKIVYRD